MTCENYMKITFASINKVLLGQSPLIHLHIVYSSFHTTNKYKWIKLLSSCNRKLQNLKYLLSCPSQKKSANPLIQSI